MGDVVPERENWVEIGSWMCHQLDIFLALNPGASFPPYPLSLQAVSSWGFLSQGVCCYREADLGLGLGCNVMP